MELFIIRHAQSYNNALKDQRNRVRDPNLTDLGRKQADLLAEHLARGANLESVKGTSEEDTTTIKEQGFGLEKVYCSAMLRAMQTALPISRTLDMAPEIWVDIHEHGGIFLDGEDGPVGYPGQTRGEIEKDFPGYVIPPTITAEGWWQGTFESWPECYARAIRTAHGLRKMAKGTTGPNRVAIITHGGFIDALLKALLNQLPGQGFFFHHFNTAISRLDFIDGYLNIRYLNRVGHLPPDLVS